jgi:hypothetical protein
MCYEHRFYQSKAPNFGEERRAPAWYRPLGFDSDFGGGEREPRYIWSKAEMGHSKIKASSPARSASTPMGMKVLLWKLM